MLAVKTYRKIVNGYCVGVGLCYSWFHIGHKYLKKTKNFHCSHFFFHNYSSLRWTHCSFLRQSHKLCHSVNIWPLKSIISTALWWTSCKWIFPQSFAFNSQRVTERVVFAYSEYSTTLWKQVCHKTAVCKQENANSPKWELDSKMQLYLLSRSKGDTKQCKFNWGKLRHGRTTHSYEGGHDTDRKKHRA